MEREIKLSPVMAKTASEIFAAPDIAPFLGPLERTDMETVYFTDSQGVLEGLKAALRLRRENGVSVCCFKMEKAVGRALSERLELSCEAPDIKSGAHDLALMPEMPESAKNTLLNGELLPVCSCVFTRTHGVFEKDGLSFVLSYDTGELSKGKAKGSICELELEHVSGDISLMEKLADGICAKYGLSPCSLSKYQRAMALMDTDEKAL